MKETMQNSNSLFFESVNNHQKLVDILVSVRDEGNISNVSLPEIAKSAGRSQIWVTQAIKRLNVEDLCIEMLEPGKYLVHYPDILKNGVFSKIMALIIECYQTPELFNVPDDTIAEERGLNIRTVQMFKAYMQTGWKKSSSELSASHVL